MPRGHYDGNFGGSEPGSTKYRDENWLREQYVENERTLKDISDECDVSMRTIGKWRDEFGLDKRDSGGYTDSAKHRDEEWLRQEYVEKGRSLWELADDCDAHADTIRRWLNRYDIETRDRGCPSGEKAPWYGKYGSEHKNWEGGEFPYGEGWNDAKREAVRERDGYECVECGVPQTEHREKFDCALHVHHIQPARSFENPSKRNSTANLVTLCIPCHLSKWEHERGNRQARLPVTTDDETTTSDGTGE